MEPPSRRPAADFHPSNAPRTPGRRARRNRSDTAALQASARAVRAAVSFQLDISSHCARCFRSRPEEAREHTSCGAGQTEVECRRGHRDACVRRVREASHAIGFALGRNPSTLFVLRMAAAVCSGRSGHDMTSLKEGLPFYENARRSNGTLGGWPMPLMLLASGTVQRNTASVKLSILREGEATERLPWTTRPGYVPSASPPSPVSPRVTRYIADTFKMAARCQPSMSVRVTDCGPRSEVIPCCSCSRMKCGASPL